MSTIKHVFFVGRTSCPLIQPGFQKRYDVSVNTTCLQLSSVEYLSQVIKTEGISICSDHTLNNKIAKHKAPYWTSDFTVVLVSLFIELLRLRFLCYKLENFCDH